ncbi:retinol dehydrogenase 12 [Tribolium castaneum]|uniref:WW domain-containing oxidoreductase-like Protein n=1 Tax=Tribolium castaneum TaxID=7070 RepID=D6X0B1_TRICA|nr:PREDICTED: retinol dehydrogenase 12 [Tribolium castaneum]EFA10518.1 WW domain-containing oxidoreductase-like Protein [Tribolium castaneum]|eukprot:XP_008198376.1 PREDICTED: retinol dehydrogenase 12 [Tribolium castaneum]
MNYYAIFCVVLAPLILKIYLKLSTKWCRSHKCLTGKTAIITGANTGIGFETALDFAKRGARVILACRDPKKADLARQKIVEETENSEILVKIVDFASFESVRAFVKSVHETEKRLDILVNNAGVAPEGTQKTHDGFYQGMQVNYLSLFLLTNLLLGLMSRSGPARIVNVSSAMAQTALFFNPDNLCTYNGDVDMYSRTKLCIILFTQQLAKKLQNTQITTYSLHPGAVKTEIFRHVTGFKLIVFGIIKNFFAKTPAEGAQTNIYCSVEKNIEGFSGLHFEECRTVATYPNARDSKVAEKLWTVTEELVKLKEEEKFQFPG